MYVSTKSYDTRSGFSIAYRQWKADSHCKYIHGYALGFDFEFESETLDVRNWVCDFGGFKTLKSFLEEYFDHTLLVAQDDPELEFFKEIDRRGLAQVREVTATGCEGLSEWLYWYMNEVWLPENGYQGSNVHCRKVHVHETEANSGWVEFTKEGWAEHLAKENASEGWDVNNGNDMISEGGCL
jgi:6-pyruvoyltetrahydropterin/6-carboxytetrahydropterin synthase